MTDPRPAAEVGKDCAEAWAKRAADLTKPSYPWERVAAIIEADRATVAAAARAAERERCLRDVEERLLMIRTPPTFDNETPREAYLLAIDWARNGMNAIRSDSAPSDGWTRVPGPELPARGKAVLLAVMEERAMTDKLHHSGEGFLGGAGWYWDIDTPVTGDVYGWRPLPEPPGDE